MAWATFQMHTSHIWHVVTVPDSTGLGEQLRLAQTGPIPDPYQWSKKGGQQTFSANGQRVDIFDFVGSTVYIATTHLCCCIMKAATE